MFKSVHKQVWVFDLEWVPDAEAGRLLYDLPNSMSELEVWEVMWKEGGADESNPRPFLKTALCRIVSVAAVVRKTSERGTQLKLMSLPENPDNIEERGEAAIIQRFLDGIGRARPQLVGYNSINADIKILIQRGVANGITAPQFSQRPNKPWEGFDYFSKGSEGHIDLSNIVGGWGKAMPSLNEIATISGIPGKFGIAGSDVAALWSKENLRDIVQYNECDALTTYLLWLRLTHFGGFISSDDYQIEQNLVRDMLQRTPDAKPHLLNYLHHWNELVSR